MQTDNELTDAARPAPATSDSPGTSPRVNLEPLLAPRSIAFLGASTRADTPGLNMVQSAVMSGYTGRMYPVHPSNDSVCGLRCYPRLDDLPEIVDHVVIGLGNPHLDRAIDEVIAHGARAATVFASGHIATDQLKAKAQAAGLALCGPNCMGFLNPAAPLYVAGYPTPTDLAAGGVTLIAQSGSVFGAMAHGDRRLRYNLLVSSGAEWCTTAADYMHWSLDQDTTRVIALFLESVRDPENFRDALRRAADQDTPVVALKVGRTPQSAAMAITHSGAIAGSDAAFSALCDRYGVTRVETIDELAACVLAFGQRRKPASGGLATMHDSGGQREMLVDLATELDVPFARIGMATRERLRDLLDPGLEPENPLDAWGTGREFSAVFEGCLEALVQDPDTAMAIWFEDLRDISHVSDGCERAALAVAARTDKPLLFATNYSLGRYQERALRLTAAGVPVLDGSTEALKAARHLLAWRDFRNRTESRLPAPSSATTVETWRARLASGRALDEPEALRLLEAFSIPVTPWRLIDAREGVEQAAIELGLPLVLKSAAPGLQHKTEADGVRLNLATLPAALDAFDDIAVRLGSRMIAARMIRGGVELGLGALVDPQFGPYVVASAGGILIEMLDDKSVALAPTGTDEARRLMDGLRISRLLQGYRGGQACDRSAIADTLSRLSVLIATLDDVIDSIDINPLICTAQGCSAADALIAVRHPPDSD